MAKIKNFIENNFSLLLILGCVLGFFVPSFGETADEIVIFLTALLIFFSCSNIKPTEFLQVDIFQIGVFILLRYAVFPLVLFYGAHQIFPEYAVGVLLLALMPAGVTVSALCSMSGANVALGLSLIIVSSLLAPVFVPGVFSFLGQIVNVDVMALFVTLVMVVFIPILLYFLVFSKVKIVDNFAKNYNKSSSIIILSLILVIVIATQKQTFLEAPEVIYVGLLIMTGLFAIFYAFGIIYSLFMSKGQRLPYIFSSGAMNNSLAVGLAFAYFDPKITLFIVLSEIVFSFYIAFSQYVASRWPR